MVGSWAQPKKLDSRRLVCLGVKCLLNLSVCIFEYILLLLANN